MATPAAPVSGRARTGDATLHWVESGTGDPLLLIHGYPFTCDLWASQLAELPPGWRAIAPDLRGFGGSSAGGATVLTMDVFARDLLGLLDHLEIDRAVVCGLSMGGYIAFELLHHAPERVRALALCDTRAAADDAEAAAARTRVAEAALAGGAPALLESMLGRLLAPDTLRTRPDIVSRLRAMMQATSPATLARAALGMAERRDATAWLGSIGVPTLVVVGEADAISPPTTARALAAAIPGARLETIAGAGHVPCLEQPDAFNRALWTFLRDAGSLSRRGRPRPRRP